MFKSVDLDGTQKGYDKNIIRIFGNKTKLPFLDRRIKLKEGNNKFSFKI